MKKQLHQTLWLALSLFFFQNAQAQHPINKIDAESSGATVTLRADSLDVLYPLAGDDNPDHPYYTFLWIFGDGSFVNGTRDAKVSHDFEKWGKQNFTLGLDAGAEVTVYSVGSYSGGTRPPRLPEGSQTQYRSPTVLARKFKPAALGTLPNATAPPFSVFETGNDSALLRLQLNSNVRPQDTMVSIISFRQPGKQPAFPIEGQLYFFYNSSVETEPASVKKAALSEIKNPPPPPPPVALTHGKTDYQRTLLHFTNTGLLGTTGLGGTGVTEFQDVAVFDFNNLDPDGLDERHLFLEMVNDSAMWELFKDGREDELRFLAVLVVSNPDAIPSLPNAADGYLESAGLQSLLLGNTFDDSTFIPLGPNDPQPQIVAYDQVTSPVVSAHDPNHLTLYACECPATASVQHKVIGVVEFSNDGTASTENLTIALNVPEGLNLNSVQAVSIEPAPIPAIAPVVDVNARTVTWFWPALLKSAAEVGFGHQATKGQIVFTANLKDSTAVADLGPMDACITFDLNTPMCTIEVPGDSIVTAFHAVADSEAGELLECVKCENYPDEAPPGSIDWWCAMLWALGILLLIIVVWFIRRLVS